MTIDNLSRFAIAASIVFAAILLYLRPTADRYKDITPKESMRAGIISQYLDSSEGKVYSLSFIEKEGKISIYDIKSGQVTTRTIE